MTTSKPPFKQTTPTPTLPVGTTRFLSAYGPKRKVAVTFVGNGRTKQQFRDECDINKIIDRFKQTGLIDFVNKHQGQYMDCTGFDYQEAMQQVTQANSMFMQMPAELRAEFGNSPQKFVEFCGNPANRPRLAEMGLLRDGADSGHTPTGATPATQSTPAPASPTPIQDAPGT